MYSVNEIATESGNKIYMQSLIFPFVVNVVDLVDVPFSIHLCTSAAIFASQP